MSRYQKYKESYVAYREANQERILEMQRQWREKHPYYFIEYNKRNLEHRREYAHAHQDAHNEFARRWRENNPEKKSAHNLIHRHPEKYPLDSKCAFCETTKKLEHGHIDYDFPELYLTVCHQCNYWMDKTKTWKQQK